MRDPITGARILGPVVETVLLLAFGVLPATIMCVGAYGILQGEASTWDHLWFAAALFGTAGLWNTLFYRPSRTGHYAWFVLVLLLFGVLAVAPFTGGVLVSMVKERDFTPGREIADAMLSFWFLFGPVSCAAYVFARQLTVRIRSKKSASNKRLQPIAREDARSG